MFSPGGSNLKPRATSPRILPRTLQSLQTEESHVPRTPRIGVNAQYAMAPYLITAPRTPTPARARTPAPSSAPSFQFASRDRESVSSVSPRILSSSPSVKSSLDAVMVVCRVRPLQAPLGLAVGLEDAEEFEGCTHVGADGTDLTVAPLPAAEAGAAAQPQHFTFDRVFSPSSTQQDVFAAIGAPVLQSILAGFNGCVLAYGQTASGKTHTIHGPPSLDRLLASGAIAGLLGTPGAFAASPSISPDGELGSPVVAAPSDAVLADAGLLHRLMRGLFAGIADAGADRSFTLSCQFIEIYKEALRDLLARSADSARSSPRQPGMTGRSESSMSLVQQSQQQQQQLLQQQDAASIDIDDDADTIAGMSECGESFAAGSSTGDRPRPLHGAVFSPPKVSTDAAGAGGLKIREDPAKGVFVDGATMHPVTSPRDVYEALAIGAGTRATASTKMNARSSRSHSIFQLYITQKRLDSLTTVRSTLTIVDLAGSERVDKTGAVGARLDEAKKILFSLHALGNVINALTDGRSSHIPYRDSKLTRLLQESLGGNSRTVLVLAVSPAQINREETLSTLRFGRQAKRIVNKPRVNEDRSPGELTAILDLRDAEIARLRAEVARLASAEALLGPVAPPPAPLGPSHSAFEVPPGGGGTGGGGATPEVARLKVQVVDLAGQVARQQADAAVYADHARAKYAKLVVSTGLLMDRQRDYKSRVEATLVGITKAVTAASSSAESPAQLEALATIARAVEGLREVTI